jgi:hypothetical protein
MFDWIGEWIFAFVTSVPPLFKSDPHHFSAARAMAALLLIVAVVYIIAMRPFGPAIADALRWIKSRFSRN